MSKLLDTEREFYTRNRRLGIYDSLAKCFDTSSRSKEEAIATAHQQYDLKAAAEQGNIIAVKEQVEQLHQPNDNLEEDKAGWAKMKFTPKS
jgi:DNA sulfur modification protein DndC